MSISSQSCRHCDLAEIELRSGAEIALQKVTARRNIHAFERVRKQLEIRIFDGQTRGRWGTGAGHSLGFLKSASPRGGWGKHSKPV